MKLSVFSIPRAFRGRFDLIQRNAIATWRRLPATEVILLGDDPGTAEVAAELGLRHVAGVQRNEYGTPLLDDAFRTAAAVATAPTLCYVNSDILLPAALAGAVDTAVALGRPFLVAGRCWNLAVTAALAADGDWERDLRGRREREGRLRHHGQMDYFVFPPGLYRDMPPFAVGRCFFDGWLVWRAVAAGAAVIDATGAVPAIHQDHDYSHVARGADWVLRGAEAEHNAVIGGGARCCRTLRSATHVLGPAGLRRRTGRHRLWELAARTQTVRARLGLNRATLGRLRRLVVAGTGGGR